MPRFFGSTGSITLARADRRHGRVGIGRGLLDGGVGRRDVRVRRARVLRLDSRRSSTRRPMSSGSRRAATAVATGWQVRSRSVPRCFQFSARPIDAALAARMQPSWRPGCPVGLESLRYLTMRHWGFDGKAHTGELVVNADAVGAIQSVMTKLWNAGSPSNVWSWSTTSRPTTTPPWRRTTPPRSTAGSSKARRAGRSTRSDAAIDINTVQNPYVDARPRLATERRGLRQPSHRCAGRDPRRRRRGERVRRGGLGAGAATSRGQGLPALLREPAGRSEPITPEWCLARSPGRSAMRARIMILVVVGVVLASVVLRRPRDRRRRDHRRGHHDPDRGRP